MPDAGVETVTANPALHTRDLGGKATTAEVTQAVCDHLATSAERQAA
jgi:tartrate dehydrogenase/decarboxylase/D-malate dehydrogenase